MSKTLGPNTTSHTLIGDHVSAVLGLVGQSRPPTLEISYQGLAEPFGLWSALEALGWEVPSRPPPPASAIEWATEGESSAHRVRPWRVDGFTIRPRSWRGEERDAVVVQTLQSLARHGVHVTTDPPELLGRTGDPTPPTAARAPSAAGIPAVAPGVIALSAGTSGPIIGGDVVRYSTITASPVTTAWWETTATIDQVLMDPASASLETTAVWSVEEPANELPAATSPQRTELRMIVPDAYGDGGLVQRLTRLMEDRIEATVLRPVESGRPSSRLGLLLAGDVETARLIDVASILVSRYPDVICRGHPA